VGSVSFSGELNVRRRRRGLGLVVGPHYGGGRECGGRSEERAAVGRGRWESHSGGVADYLPQEDLARDGVNRRQEWGTSSTGRLCLSLRPNGRTGRMPATAHRALTTVRPRHPGTEAMAGRSRFHAVRASPFGSRLWSDCSRSLTWSPLRRAGQVVSRSQEQP
jgi:hypothetical protein